MDSSLYIHRKDLIINLDAQNELEHADQSSIWQYSLVSCQVYWTADFSQSFQTGVNLISSKDAPCQFFVVNFVILMLIIFLCILWCEIFPFSDILDEFS